MYKASEGVSNEIRYSPFLSSADAARDIGAITDIERQAVIAAAINGVLKNLI
jgi:hypothetical protein